MLPQRGLLSQKGTSLQDFVNFCAQQNQPEVIEAAVMHMDLASLDLNQVMSTALASSLLSGSLHLDCSRHTI